MDILEYKYNLQELLYLKIFSRTFETINSDNFNKAVVAWAEREVMIGDSSETLLIIASLGLDSTIDTYEVEKYLLRYQQEENIKNPLPYESALFWLKLELGRLIKSKSSFEIEDRLSFFTQNFLYYPPRAFCCITSILSNLYWELYDEDIPAFYSRASQMSEDKLLEYIKDRLSPFYRILNTPEWVGILT